MSNLSYFLSSSSSHFLFFISTYWLIICLTIIKAETAQNETRLVPIDVGVVLDMKSPMDRMVNECVSVALSDFYAANPNYRTRLLLQTRDSSNDLLDTASSVIGLLKSEEVHAILGLQRSTESSFVKKLGEKASVPIISISSTSLSSPSPSNINPYYFIKIGQDESSQLKAITNLFQKFGWDEVILIFEEDMEVGIELFSCLVTNSSQEINVLVAYKSLISPKANESEILNELNVLKPKDTKVILVHMSVDLGSRFFALVEREKMMSKGYAWIIIDSLSHSLEAMDPSVVASMEGVIGIQSHVPESKNLDRFKSRYEFDRQQYSMSDPNMVKISGLNIFGLWAYDTIWALAMAAERIGVELMDSRFSNSKSNYGECSTKFADLGTSKIGPRLLEEVSNMKSFPGLSGDFKLVNGQLQPMALELFNVIEKRKRVIGYWTPERRRWTKDLVSTTSMNNELKSIIWPGDSTKTPLGTAGETIRIGVPNPNLTTFPEFVNPGSNKRKGLSLEVFEAVWESTSLGLKPEFIVLNSTNYDEFCQLVYNKVSFASAFFHLSANGVQIITTTISEV